VAAVTLLADTAWAETRRSCHAQFETVFGHAPSLGHVAVLSAALASALDS
jgi:hypothetical protein